jgi:xylulokinase
MTHLGIDLGTGSLKLLLVTSEGAERVWSEPYAIRSPKPGFAETDTSDWLAALRATTARLPPGPIDSIGMSGQMHGVVPCNWKRGALHPAILWADQRGKEVLSRLAALGPGPARRVRNSWVSGMAIATVLWIRENEPELFRDTDVFLSPKDYLRWVITGQVGTDRSDASGTLLYDFASGTWMSDVLETLSLDPGKLPPILDSAALAGRVSSVGARLTGLPAGSSVGVGAADTAAAILGSGLPVSDTMQISIGSGTQVVRLLSELPEFQPALNVFESVRPGVYYQMAGMLNGGVALEWVRKTVGLDWTEFYALASQEKAPLDLVFLPYLAGERTPYLNPDARASWIGLGLHHRPVDLLHAALLGVACSVRLGLQTMGTEGVSHYRMVGGSTRYPYWNQMLANVLQASLAVSPQGDISARGAAMLGAEAIGIKLDYPEDFVVYQPEALDGIDDYYRRFTDLYTRLHP